MPYFTVMGPRPLVVTVPYAGPGDIVSGASAWWGLRAYSAAAAGNVAIKVQRSSDTTQADISTLANGSLNVADAFFDGSTTYTIVTWYDQTGNGNHQTQGTNSQRAVLILSDSASLPAAQFTQSSSQGYNSVTSPSATATPWSVSGVFKYNATDFAPWGTVGSPLILLRRTNTPNQISFYDNGNVQTATANDGAYHAGQYISNGASSDLYVDGSSNTGTTMDSSTFALADFHLGGEGAFSYFDGKLREGGMWPSTFSAGNKSSMNSNQHTYWGF